MRSIAALLFLVAVPNLVFAQEYPSRPVRIIVAYTPGGGTDLAGRAQRDRTRAVHHPPACRGDRDSGSRDVPGTGADRER